MRARRLEPFEDLQAPLACQGAEDRRSLHFRSDFGNCLIAVINACCLTMQQIIDRAGIAAAERPIRPYIRHTPIIRIDSADLGIAGEPLVLKLEFLQHTGSAKPRAPFASPRARTAPPAR